MVAPAIRTYPHFKSITPQKLRELTPTFLAWGYATATGLTLLGSDIPIVRQDILDRIPFVGKYFPVKAGPPEEVFHRVH